MLQPEPRAPSGSSPDQRVLLRGFYRQASNATSFDSTALKQSRQVVKLTHLNGSCIDPQEAEISEDNRESMGSI